jgi:hypothetical protein
MPTYSFVSALFLCSSSQTSLCSDLLLFRKTLAKIFVFLYAVISHPFSEQIFGEFCENKVIEMLHFCYFQSCSFSLHIEDNRICKKKLFQSVKDYS